MNFDDHDWEIGQPPTREARDTSSFWKVAAGVAVGMVLGGVLVFAIDRQQAPTANAGAVPSIDRQLRGLEPTAAGDPPRPPPAAELPMSPPPQSLPPPVPSAAPERASKVAETGAVVDSQLEIEAAQRAARRAAERKERAWANYYQKPAQCDENSTKSVMVECANHYIRTRRQFEESYSAGKR